MGSGDGGGGSGGENECGQNGIQMPAVDAECEGMDGSRSRGKSGELVGRSGGWSLKQVWDYVCLCLCPGARCWTSWSTHCFFLPEKKPG